MALSHLLFAAAAEAQGVSFIVRREFGAGGGPVSVAVGDFNGDGKPDLAVANSVSNDVSVLLGNGDGSFQAARNFSAGISPVSVAIAMRSSIDARSILVTGLPALPSPREISARSCRLDWLGFNRDLSVAVQH
jgi:hypothetical protein